MTAEKDAPLATFALVTYNQERYIRDAIKGAFAQTYRPLEIIISDDHSLDATYSIIRDEAETSAPQDISVNIFRNSKNVGLAAHVNAVIEKSSGEFIVFAAGDDISLPERVRYSVDPLVKDASIMSVLTDMDLIDEFGVHIGRRTLGQCRGKLCVYTLDDVLKGRLMTAGASRTIRRSLATVFGMLFDDCPTEDTPYLLRSAMAGTVAYLPEVTVLYRKHEGSLSQAESILTMNFQALERQYRADVLRACDLNLLSASQKVGALRWATRMPLIRVVEAKLRTGSRPSFREMLSILARRDIKGKVKLRILVQYGAKRLKFLSSLS